MNSADHRIVLPLSCALLLSGCASMTETGYLADYGRLTRGKHLERVWHDPDIQLPSNSLIVLQDINIDYIHDQRGVTVADAAQWLREAVLRHAQSENLNIVLQDVQNQGGYLLELAITQMTPGNSAARLWAAEFGFGYAQVQIEGTLSDRIGSVFCAFGEVRTDSGAIGFEDFIGDVGPHLVHNDLDHLARSIVLELKTYVSTLPPG